MPKKTKKVNSEPEPEPAPARRTIQTRSTARGMGNNNSTKAQTSIQKSRKNRNVPSPSQTSTATATASIPTPITKKMRPMTADEKREAQFEKYFDSEDEEKRIKHQGFEQWMNDLKINMDSEIPLLLCWKLKVSTMGYVTKDEWMNGLRAWGVESNDQLQSKLRELNNVFTSPDLFKDLYRYSFDYVKEKNQRCIDVDTALYMWDQLFAKRPSRHVKDFTDFLKESKQPKVLTRDQWTNFLEFVTTIEDDLSNYDLESAWPCLFDEYVEWKKAKKGIAN